jgi:lipopolysaccharide export system permease protein
LSLTRWIRPVLMFGLPIIVLTGLLSFFLTPWANQKSSEFKQRYEKREDIAMVSPGKFQESASSNRVFFVEGVSGDASKVKNIFVNTVQDGRTSVVIANEGTMEINERGEKFLVMSQGRRYDGVPNQSDFQMMEFERYGVLVAQQSQAVLSNKSARATSTAGLLMAPTPYNLGELLWRAALPLMALLLMLLAIPLSFVNPRAGRSANLLIALLIFVVYSNSVSVFQAAVVQNKLTIFMAWWPIHLLAVVLTGLLFLWRLKMNSHSHPLQMWATLKRNYLFRKSGN